MFLTRIFKTAVLLAILFPATPVVFAQDTAPDPVTVQEQETAPAASQQVEESDPVASEQAEEVDPTVELFAAKCASCHTVGDGDRVGPDLAAAHQRRDRAWLTQMIQTPSRMLGSDPVARRLLVDYKNVKMPDLGLDIEQTNSLIELIARCSTEPCDLAGKFVPITTATDADFQRGRALFLGEEPMVGGAVACVACHAVGGMDTLVPGGTLAVDLTHVFARLGDEGLDAALQSPGFILMNRVYADHPLESEEAFALRAFLYDVNRRGPDPSETLSLPLFGILLAGIMLVILNAFWRRRMKGVRKLIASPSIRS